MIYHFNLKGNKIKFLNFPTARHSLVKRDFIIDEQLLR